MIPLEKEKKIIDNAKVHQIKLFATGVKLEIEITVQRNIKGRKHSSPFGGKMGYLGVVLNLSVWNLSPKVS